MDYKVLYRKYRPTTFKEVKGQDHIVTTLKNVILSDKISHSYIFNGPRGIGKTSVAKIFANVINCQHTSNKLIACDACHNVIENHIDVIEMDAASNNGVDEIRDLKNKIEHTPVKGRFKIYIIDEVHMLSKSAFNALLKTLEEPPQHVIFILATTDPQKIPSTIISRSQRFNFRRISQNTLATQLRLVLKNENIQIEESALKLIATLAEGGMRDALSIADQCAAFGNGVITYDDILNTFGIVANNHIVLLINALSAKDIGKALLIFNKLKEQGVNPALFVKSLINIARDWVVFRKTKNIELLETAEADEIKNLRWHEKYIYKLIPYFQKVYDQILTSELPFQIVEFALVDSINLHESIELDFVNKQPEIVNNNTTTNIDIQFIEDLIQKEIQKWTERQPLIDYQALKISEEEFNKGIEFDEIEEKEETNDELQEEFEYIGDNPDTMYTNADKMTEIFEDSFVNSKLEDTEVETQLNSQISENDETIEDFSEMIEKDKEVNEKITTKEWDLNDLEPQEQPELLNKINEIATEKQIDSIDIDFNNAFQEKEEKEKSNLEEIINAFQQSSKQFLTSFHNYLKIAELNEETNSEFYEQLRFIQKFKLVGANQDFWVLYSEDNILVEKMKEQRDKIWLQKFIKKYFNNYIRIFLVDSFEFKAAISTIKQIKYKEIPAQPLWPVKKLTLDDEDDVKKLGKKIFGDFAKINRKNK